MKIKHCLTAVGVLLISMVGCRTPDRMTNYTITINDSLFWEKKTGDSLVSIKGSYLPLVVLPSDMKDGDTIKKKEGQANLEVVKKGDTLYLAASCDSLLLKINILEEKLSYASKTNENLQEQVKAAPNRFTWFSYGFGAGLLFLGIIILVAVYIIRRKS